MKLFRQATVLSLLVFGVSVSMAQNNYQSGKIITNNNDTLFGYIDTKSDSRIFRECRFKKSLDAKPASFSTQTIKEFDILSSSRRFISNMPSSPVGNTFTEVICVGKLSLYFQYNSDIQFYIYKVGDSLIHPLPYFKNERYVDNGYTKRLRVIESDYHIDTLKMLMKDKTELFPEIEKIQSPDKINLKHLVDLYNNTTVAIQVQKKQETDRTSIVLIKKGKISLYSLKNKNNTFTYYIQKEANPSLIELPFTTFENTNFKGIKIRSYSDQTTNHIDTLKKYMADAKPLYPMIDEIRTPNVHNLSNLVDEYNSYTNEKAFTEKHKLKRLPVNMDLIPGLYLVFINPNFPIERLGINIDCGFINSNTHFFLKSGFFAYTGDSPLTDLYSVSEDHIDYSKPKLVIKVPLLFEYRFKESQIQPLIAVGYNFYKFKEVIPYNKAIMPVVCPGFNLAFGRRLAARVNAEIEFENGKLVSWTPEKIKRVGLFVGLQVKL